MGAGRTAFDTFAHPASVHDGRLVLGMLQPATVHAFDGAAGGPRQPARRSARCDEIHSLATFHGALHAGTWPLGRVARWDAARRRWRQTGRLGDSSEVMALNVYNGKLYGSTIPRAEVFRYERDALVDEPAPPVRSAGLAPGAGSEHGHAAEAIERQREWTRVTSLTQHDGLVFASVGSCTSAAVDAPADVRGTVHAFGTGVVATTPRSLSPGRHHVAAVRRGGALSIHVDGARRRRPPAA